MPTILRALWRRSTLRDHCLAVCPSESH